MLRAGSRIVAQDSPSAVREGAECLRRGGLLVALTDTIYGILADATSPQALEKLYRLRRPSRRPFIVLVPDPFWVGKLGLAAGCPALRLLGTPSLTVVLRKRTTLYRHLGDDTVAVRYPRRGFVYRLLREFGGPIVAPSANREGEPPARSVAEAVAYFGDEVDLYIDSGRCGGAPSTVVDVDGRVFRRGAYSRESVERILEITRRFPCPVPDLSPHPLCPGKPPRGRGS